MWQEITDNKTGKSSLVRNFQFRNFSEAFAFMTQVAFIAEKLNHHPEWSNIYNKVTVKLSTHDAGDVITEKDRQMAAFIDQI
ncbi:MAG: 4a-hydroxytetrahydrobiopterin dehydratase [Lentimicrobiaceae bacterium]|nr:4a-hydroxytetrahydrobiopterin dehydratase [Lentimicrobiaceae bacterium]MCO5264787.1 4a-hydroxytetrahydrobiopterin dehydratase [Lentimicrobium sp.]